MTPAKACPHQNSRRPAKAPSAFLPLLPFLSGMLAIVAPKCPLCLAGYLSVIGLGMGTATILAPVIRPLAIVFAILATLVIIVVFARRARHARA